MPIPLVSRPRRTLGILRGRAILGCPIIALVLFASLAAALRAQPAPDSAPAPIQMAVWPQLAPGETTSNPGTLGDTSGNVARLTNVTSPQLFIYPLSGKPPGPAVLVCPGGAYQILATDLEGSEIARWLNKEGYVAAVLHYRVPDNRDGALQDAQRAMSLLRAHAQEYGIDPSQLGVMGFSAGGHLSARLAVSGDNRTYPSIDAVDKQSCRPSFALLIYPAYLSASGPGGIAPDVAPEVAPVAGMPPMFLAQAKDDHYLDTPQYAQALEQARIPVKSCLYASGGHGYGLRGKAEVPSTRWPLDAAQWLLDHYPPQP